MGDLEQPDVQVVPLPGTIPDGRRLYDIHAAVAVMQHQLKAVDTLDKRVSRLETFRTRVLSTVAVFLVGIGSFGAVLVEVFRATK